MSEQNLYSQIAGQIAPIKDRQEIAYVIDGLKAGKVNEVMAADHDQELWERYFKS